MLAINAVLLQPNRERKRDGEILRFDRARVFTVTIFSWQNTGNVKVFALVAICRSGIKDLP